MGARRSPMCRVGCYMPHLCAGWPSECLMAPKRYYPLFADLRGRPCLVVGGGLVAQRKITTLLGYGARVTVVSPAVTRRIAAYARQGKVRHAARRFRAADLRDAWLVYAATDDREINRRVYETAKQRRVFANVVDQTPLCTFIAPAIARRGPLTIAVSTSGTSPSLAKKLRTELKRRLGAEYGALLRLLTGLRGIAKKRLPSYQDRKRYFDRLVQGRVFALTRDGRPGAARREALALLDRFAPRSAARGMSSPPRVAGPPARSAAQRN